MVKSSIHNPTRSLARRLPYREPRKRILIVCEGTVTEPQYFDDFRRDEHNPLVDVVIDEKGGSPKTLVERAAQRKKAAEKEAERFRDEHLKYDEVWCVYDIDSHRKLADAFRQARDNEIRLAVSNPCFELWLLLHFGDQTAHIERDKVRVMLRKHLLGYKKRVDFEKLKSRYTDAVKRATLLNKRCEENGDKGGNPSTGVYELTERIVALSFEARAKS